MVTKVRKLVFDEEIDLYYYRARYYDSELWRFISRDPIWQIDDINLYAYVGNNPVMFIDPDWEAKVMIDKWFTWLTAWFTLAWFWLLWIIDEDMKYSSQFLWNSLIWATELKYYDGSDYVKKLKTTNDYKFLVNTITEEVKKGNGNYSSSSNSSDQLTIFTLWKFDYEVISEKKESYTDINIKITDVYDFNKEPYDGSFLNNYLNVMHKANKYNILTPINIEINTNERIYDK